MTIGSYLQASGQITIHDIHDTWVYNGFAGFQHLQAYAGQTVYDGSNFPHTVPSTNLDIEFFYGMTPTNFAGPPGGGGGGK